MGNAVLDSASWRAVLDAANTAIHSDRTKTYSANALFQPAKVRTSAGLVSCMDNAGYLGSYLAGFDDLTVPEYITPFLGYNYIAQLRKDAIYSNIVTTYAEDMTDNFMVPEPRDGDKSSVEFCKDLHTEALDVWGIDEGIREAWASHFGWDGGGLEYISLKGDISDEELATPLVLDDKSFKKGSLEGFIPVEAIDCCPVVGNVTNPLSVDYYQPVAWRVWGKTVHASRFLYYSQNRLPAMLRPVYNFFGIPLVSTLEPFRAGFEKARVSSLDAIRNHALLYFKTNLASMISEGCADAGRLLNRVKLFLSGRSIDGMAIIDKDTEDFQQINTPLSELANLSSLHLQLLSAANKMPVTKAFGTNPPGMDASGDNYRYDWAKTIYGLQKRILQRPTVRKYQILQLNKWGTIREDIRYSWPRVVDLTDSETKDLELKQAQIDQIYTMPTATGDSILSAQEVRERMSGEASGVYSGIDIEQVRPDDADLLDDDEADSVDGDTPEDLAMNGAQVTALQGIVEGVAAGTLPKEAAKQMIMIAFPTVPEKTINAMFADIKENQNGQTTETVSAAQASGNAGAEVPEEVAGPDKANGERSPDGEGDDRKQEPAT